MADGAIRTDKTLHVTDKLHGIVEHDGNDTRVDEHEEDKRKKLPPSPAMLPCER